MSVWQLALLGAGSAIVVWRASIALEGAANRLCDRYAIPEIVQGTLVAAVASSLPEVVGSMLSTVLHGDFELGVAIVVGSAIFNVLVIPGLSSWKRPMEASREAVYRDAQFYVISIAVLLLAFSLAVIYHPLPGEALQGELGRPLVLLPLALYGLYLFLQFQDSADRGADRRPRRPVGDAESRARDDWIRVLVCAGLVTLGTEGLVRMAIGLGESFGTPSFLWGVTVVAAASSAPDAVISVQAAVSGRGVVSIGNVLGSNIFDLLVAIPLAVLVGGSVVVSYATVTPLVGLLTVATILLLAFLRTAVRLTPMEGRFLLGLYVVFVAWMVCETAGITSVLPSAAFCCA